MLSLAIPIGAEYARSEARCLLSPLNRPGARFLLCAYLPSVGDTALILRQPIVLAGELGRAAKTGKKSA